VPTLPELDVAIAKALQACRGEASGRALPAPRLTGFKSFVEPTEFRIEPG
jgi:hypothetical protein